jgi:uncharacterized Zn ribbon protein
MQCDKCEKEIIEVGILFKGKKICPECFTKWKEMLKNQKEEQQKWLKQQ